MKVIFLNVDGVLNNGKTTEMYRSFVGIDPSLAQLVTHIVKNNNCEVVLSSSWRLLGHTCYATDR
jgi:Swiss Army Knife RNA repair-like protein